MRLAKPDQAVRASREKKAVIFSTANYWACVAELYRFCKEKDGSLLKNDFKNFFPFRRGDTFLGWRKNPHKIKLFCLPSSTKFAQDTTFYLGPESFRIVK